MVYVEARYHGGFNAGHVDDSPCTFRGWATEYLTFVIIREVASFLLSPAFKFKEAFLLDCQNFRGYSDEGANGTLATVSNPCSFIAELCPNSL